MDPVAVTAATMGVVKGLHHPYAAMLLVDYILSKEGQQILANAEYFPADPDVRAAAGTGAGRAEDRRRAGEFRRPRQADQIYRQFRGDLPEAVPVRTAGQGRRCVEGRAKREHTGRKQATWTPALHGALSGDIAAGPGAPRWWARFRISPLVAVLAAILLILILPPTFSSSIPAFIPPGRTARSANSRCNIIGSCSPAPISRQPVEHRPLRDRLAPSWRSRSA